MYLHEFQSKNILMKNKIKCPYGYILKDLSDLQNILDKIRTTKLILKAQIHSGGRKKSGGIKICNKTHSLVVKNITNIKQQAFLLNNKEFIKPNIILIEEFLPHKYEFYISISTDKNSNKILILTTKYGGIDVEKKKKITKTLIDTDFQVHDYQIRSILDSLNLDINYFNILKKFIIKLVKLYTKKDLLLLEINPFTIKKKKIICLDAKFEFDDNAEYRHPDIIAMKDETQINHIENEAKKYKLNYVKLDGKIGCIVNGAGLAMATIDLITSMSGTPANFLDVGGSIDSKNFMNAIKITLINKDVNVIFINIFGGIVRCDLIATSLINIHKELKINVPIVLRLEGNKSDEAIDMIKASLPQIYISKNLSDTIKKAIKLSENNHANAK